MATPPALADLLLQCRDGLGKTPRGPARDGCAHNAGCAPRCSTRGERAALLQLVQELLKPPA
jgi:hypothetical protein